VYVEFGKYLEQPITQNPLERSQERITVHLAFTVILSWCSGLNTTLNPVPFMMKDIVRFGQDCGMKGQERQKKE
jgi:hypothetical protein